MNLLMDQIIAASWSSGKGAGYSIFGLATDRKMYRFDRTCNNWLPCGMEIAVCAPEHEAARIKRQAEKSKKIEVPEPRAETRRFMKY